ncbi:MAG: hypothetical protein ACJ76P_04885 [Actinomycetota bacterium]
MDQSDELEILSGGTTSYRITDVKGEDRTFQIPADLPFPVTLAFLTAADNVRGVHVAAVETPTDDKKAGAYGPAWEELLEAFLPIVQIRQPEVKLEDLRDEIGQGTMGRWISVVVEKFSEAASAADPKAEPNRAERRGAPKGKAPKPRSSR